MNIFYWNKLLVAIEAMKYGKPVIASNRGVLQEIIINNVNGFIFDLDNANILYKIFDDINKNSAASWERRIKHIFVQQFTDLTMKLMTKNEYCNNKY